MLTVNMMKILKDVVDFVKFAFSCGSEKLDYLCKVFLHVGTYQTVWQTIGTCGTGKAEDLGLSDRMSVRGGHNTGLHIISF